MELAWIAAAMSLGLRHGFDWDHVAAVGDLVASSVRRGDALRLSLIYAFGHAVVVLALGTAVVILGATLPASVEGLTDRVSGLTLIVLAGYVAYSLVIRRKAPRGIGFGLVIRALERRGARRDTVSYETIEHSHPHGHDQRHDHIHSGDAARPADETERSSASVTTLHSHAHRHVAVTPLDPFATRGAFAVGAIHGIGVETPTQIGVLATASGADGPAQGLALVFIFVAGMGVSNAILAVVLSTGSRTSDRIRMVVSVAAATASVYLGITLLQAPS